MTVSKAVGPNSISTNLPKQFSDELVEPLVNVVNKSLKDGIFPDLLKFASVCPIYNKNYRAKCANYRPISLLSNLGKIFEKAMYKRIELFLAEFDLIY